MTMQDDLRHENWLLSMPDDCDRDPPENHGERMVRDFAELARTIEAAMCDPELRRQIHANRNSVVAAVDAANRIEDMLLWSGEPSLRSGIGADR
jgi:hypothetical protein